MSSYLHPETYCRSFVRPSAPILLWLPFLQDKAMTDRSPAATDHMLHRHTRFVSAHDRGTEFRGILLKDGSVCFLYHQQGILLIRDAGHREGDQTSEQEHMMSGSLSRLFLQG